MDGSRVCPQPVVCHSPPRGVPARSHDDDDDSPRRPSRGFLERGKQAFSLLHRTEESTSTGGGGRQHTRSSFPSRHWDLAGEGEESSGGGRGRQLTRDDHTSPRKRDPLRLKDADWERRRSCFLAVRTHQEDNGMMVAVGASTRDLGSALPSGTLGAPLPPPRHLDPMMDFYMETCTGDIWAGTTYSLGVYDPMVEEALAACVEVINRPLSSSLSGVPLEKEIHSPVPNTENGDKIAELNEEAAALGYSNVIHFGPGVQYDADGQAIAAGITGQVADMILDERRNTIVESMFVPCEQSILDTPAVQK